MINMRFESGTKAAKRVRIRAQFELVAQVHLQTQQQAEYGMLRMGVRVFQTDGLRGLYNGISASLLRQVRAHMRSSNLNFVP